MAALMTSLVLLFKNVVNMCIEILIRNYRMKAVCNTTSMVTAGKLYSVRKTAISLCNNLVLQ